MDHFQNRDRLLTGQEAADRLRVKKDTLDIWRSTKRYPLEYVKVGRNVRYLESAVDAFIAARTVSL
jgi:excisionase family DNA binding protein